MVTLANGFAERGHQVDLVLAQAEGPYLNEVSKAVNIVDLKARRVLTSLPGLVRYLRRERPDAMLSALNHANIISLLAGKFSRTKSRIVVSERNHLSSTIGKMNRWEKKLIETLISITYPWASKVVAISNGVADDLVETTRIKRKSVSVIYNPLNIKQVVKKAKLSETTDLFPVGRSWTVIAVGRLTRQKGFDTLLKSFSRIAQRNHTNLIILGEGELRNSLEEISSSLGISDHVKFLGFVDNPFALMREANLFVLSSRWEGFGNVLVEAMACGTPIVSTNCPSGPAEILEDGLWGRLVEVDDIEGLAKAMEEALNAAEHPDVARRAQDFSAEKAISQYLEVLLPNAGY